MPDRIRIERERYTVHPSSDVLVQPYAQIVIGDTTHKITRDELIMLTWDAVRVLGTYAKEAPVGRGCRCQQFGQPGGPDLDTGKCLHCDEPIDMQGLGAVVGTTPPPAR